MMPIQVMFNLALLPDSMQKGLYLKYWDYVRNADFWMFAFEIKKLMLFFASWLFCVIVSNTSAIAYKTLYGIYMMKDKNIVNQVKPLLTIYG